jgi:hypothetical protein
MQHNESNLNTYSFDKIIHENRPKINEDVFPIFLLPL